MSRSSTITGLQLGDDKMVQISNVEERKTVHCYVHDYEDGDKAVKH